MRTSIVILTTLKTMLMRGWTARTANNVIRVRAFAPKQDIFTCSQIQEHTYTLMFYR